MRQLVCGSLGALVAMFLAVDRTLVMATLLWLSCCGCCVVSTLKCSGMEKQVQGVYASIAEATA